MHGPRRKLTSAGFSLRAEHKGVVGMSESESGMQIITMVEEQKRSKHRYNIYINEEYAFSVHEDLIVKFRLLKGTVVTEALREEMMSEEEFQAAYRTALKYIGRAMKTAKEVKDKLKLKGYEEDIVSKVVALMNEERFIDDDFYASALAKQRLHSNKKGPLWIKRELSQKGVSKSLVEQALTQFDAEDEKLQASALALKRWPQTKGEWPARVHKISSLLHRRGFTSEAVRYAIDQLRQTSLDKIGEYDSEVYSQDGLDNEDF
jgi:regulatory protein